MNASSFSSFYSVWQVFQLFSDLHPLQRYFAVAADFDFNYYEANSTNRVDVSMKRYALWGVQPIRYAGPMLKNYNRNFWGVEVLARVRTCHKFC